MQIAFAVMVAVLVLAPLPPFQVYPVFLMKALCFALFACAFNLLIGYGGLLSFGHAHVLRLGSLRLGLYCQGRYGEPAVLGGALALDPAAGAIAALAILAARWSPDPRRRRRLASPSAARASISR